MSIFVHGDLMEQIKRDLAWVQNYVRLNVATGYTDSNKDAENFYCGLLNAAFGWKLKNLNALQMDFPAIDLGDAGSGICVQVTSTEGREKVNNTLKKFFAHRLHTEGGYQRLIVLIIGQKPTYRDSFVTEDGFDFDANRDIWDTAKLIKKIDDSGLATARAVAEYLAEQLNVPGIVKTLNLPIPNSLGVDNFRGRDKELAQLDQAIAQNIKPILISGLGGMGKTELAIHFGRRYQLGRAYWVTFEGSFRETVCQKIAKGISGLRDSSLTSESVYCRVMERLGQCSQNDVLIIDNVDGNKARFPDLLDEAYDALCELPMHLILTTRHSDPDAIEIGRLDDEELYGIFRRHRVRLEKWEMDALIQAVEGHTMMVDLIARTLYESCEDITPEMILEALRRNTLKQEDYPEVGTDHNRDRKQKQIYAHISALFSLSGVSKAGEHILCCATLLPQDGMDVKLFREALPGISRTEFMNLEKRGWLRREDHRYTIHPVVRLVCREKLEPTDKSCGEFLNAVWESYDPNQYSAEKFKQYAELFSLAADILTDAQGNWAMNAAVFLREIRLPENALQYDKQAVALRERNMPDTEELADAYNNTGVTYRALGDCGMALEYHRKAIEIRKKKGQLSGLAASCNNVGEIYGVQGDYKMALAYYLKALPIWTHLLPSEHPDLVTLYDNIGTAYQMLGKPEAALEYQLKALAIFEKILSEDHPDLAMAYDNVAATYMELKDFHKALEYQMKAVPIFERILPNRNPDLAIAYDNAGTSYRCIGDFPKALEHYLKAWAILEKLLPKKATDGVICCYNIAYTYAEMKDYYNALNYAQRAVQIARHSNQRMNPSLEALKQFEKAIRRIVRRR